MRAERAARALEPRVVGIETSDHPTDRQLMAHVKHAFGITDRVFQSTFSR
jgi:hypothetical protein